MESKRHDRGHHSRSDTPEPPSPPSYTSSHQETHKRSHSRHSPSPEHRAGRSSRNTSSERRRRRRSSSKQRSPLTISRKRSRSSERSRRHSRRERTPSRSRGKNRSRDRRRSRSRSVSRSSTNSRSRSRSRSRGRRDRDRHREGRRHHRSPDSDHHSEQVVVIQPVLPAPPVVPLQSNAFANDGSFMEMFKKMQEQMPAVQKPTTSTLEEKPVAPPPLMVGKRRGGRILKTGMVAKPKTEEKGEQPKDAWSLYMAEVKKYREVCCQEEDNTRPLVK
ncbi:arginine/serine-rich coiled-coil protein 2 isoform X1 [Diachasma alloeum]|uniref:arginine/serine-rich coiled-coil protein 2 isoform X1 n=1 Tax=Diachasma alloeum TaxID=454923 RepID=UPI0007384000|nr:arginine/serine-rich coiled-coil protein 2 isoform X1 [Diachasma alloeum]